MGKLLEMLLAARDGLEKGTGSPAVVAMRCEAEKMKEEAEEK